MKDSFSSKAEALLEPGHDASVFASIEGKLIIVNFTFSDVEEATEIALAASEAVINSMDVESGSIKALINTDSVATTDVDGLSLNEFEELVRHLHFLLEIGFVSKFDLLGEVLNS